MAEANPKSEIRNAKSGVVVPHQATWQQRLAAAVIYFSIRALAATIRFRLNDPANFFNGAPKEKIIFAIWHNRLALSAVLYRRYVLKFKPERRMAGMVSASRDGGLLAQLLELFGIEPVRGSSSRRGPQALLEMTLGRTRLRSGHHARRPARAALPRAGRRDFDGAIDRTADCAGGVSFELENPV
jgi:lysophospholipid acyltransferase (LPLAT)-like uncharacterized protein